MDMTQPICIGRHVGVCHDVSVMLVKIDVRKNFNTCRLPLLCMATINKFNHHRISDQKQIWPPQLLVTHF
jgi:hypothetical protein